MLALLTLAVVLAPSTSFARYAALVMNSRTGEVLYSHNADHRLYPASLTKIMTLYMTFDALKHGRLSLNQKLSISARAAGQAPTKLGLKRGQTITVQNAVFGLITKSANDAATVLAEGMAPSEAAFAREMTAMAHKLGMRRTSFRNASGLPNRWQMSTARDMAVLGAALIHDFPQYYHFLSLEEFDYKGKAFKNHNHLLNKYKGADGIKTGYIRASGFNLVASAKRGEDRLIGVIFGGRTAHSRDAQMARLLDRGFARVAKTEPVSVPLPIRKPGNLIMASASEELPVKEETQEVAVVRGNVPTPREHAEVAEVTPVSNAMAVQDTSADAAASTPRGWAIQIGAYSLMATARNQLYRVAEETGGILNGRQINIEKAVSDGKPFYRAQVIGFNETDARKTCHSLSKRRFSCFVVAPDVDMPTVIAQKSDS
ncbi:MAG: D-alanyl-D-alanine carboxypeptidase [Alphaproteobacteria bacterium]|nr:MAG: D-alanyl-D-alanine carboxypeptidase [Alphaproteobacteria bacterium]